MNEQNWKVPFILQWLVSTTLGTNSPGTSSKLVCQIFSFLVFFLPPSVSFFFLFLFFSFSIFSLISFKIMFIHLFFSSFFPPSFLFFLFSPSFPFPPPPPPNYLSCLHKPFLYHTGKEHNINGCGYGCGQTTALLLLSGDNPADKK